MKKNENGKLKDWIIGNDVGNDFDYSSIKKEK